MHERGFYPEKDATRQQVAKSTQNRDSKATVKRTTKRVKFTDSPGQKKTFKPGKIAKKRSKIAKSHDRKYVRSRAFLSQPDWQIEVFSQRPLFCQDL